MIKTVLKRYAIVSTSMFILSLIISVIAYQQEKMKHPQLSPQAISKRIRSTPTGKFVSVVNGIIQAPWQMPATFLAGFLSARREDACQRHEVEVRLGTWSSEDFQSFLNQLV